MEFLVFYEVPRLVAGEQDATFEQEGHALVVCAESAVDAFIGAFDWLTRRGHMVRTIKAGERLESLQRIEQERQQYEGGFKLSVVAGLMMDEMQQVYDAGVPIVGGKGDNRTMTTIISIQPYRVQTRARVATEPPDPAAPLSG